MRRGDIGLRTPATRVSCAVVLMTRSGQKGIE